MSFYLLSHEISLLITVMTLHSHMCTFPLFVVKEEEALMTAHRKEIEDTMDIVREVSEIIVIKFLILLSPCKLGIFIGVSGKVPAFLQRA